MNKAKALSLSCSHNQLPVFANHQKMEITRRWKSPGIFFLPGQLTACLVPYSFPTRSCSLPAFDPTPEILYDFKVRWFGDHIARLALWKTRGSPHALHRIFPVFSWNLQNSSWGKQYRRDKHRVLQFSYQHDFIWES